MSMNSDGLSSEPRKSRFSFKLIVGEEETKYDEAAKNDHISQLFSQSKRLLDKTRQFISVQELNRENEDNLYEVLIYYYLIIYSKRKILKLMKEYF